VQLDGAALQGTLLKVGHHGSKYSTSKKFVEMVSPEVALISVGKNSYGHPTNQTLSILKDANTKILRTDESGAIRCVSNGATFVCSAEK
jgi:beta-lactamase superfamily II metal-dependent hydrolase